MRIVENGKDPIEIPREVRAKGAKAINAFVTKKRGGTKGTGSDAGKVTQDKEE